MTNFGSSVDTLLIETLIIHSSFIEILVNFLCPLKQNPLFKRIHTFVVNVYYDPSNAHYKTSLCKGMALRVVHYDI